MKTCSKCSLLKEDSEFSLRSDNSGKLRNGCKQCASKAARDRRLLGPNASDPRIKHGQCNTKLYQVWAMMKCRCENPKHPQFKYWGGKGVSICPEWKEFLPFSNWAFSTGYVEGLYIDRRRNSEDYCPGNCHWVTSQISAVNRKTTKLTASSVEEIRRRCANGEMQKDLAREFGVARNTISNTVRQRNWKPI